MFLIDDVLVTEELYKEHFICNLDKCKGACCWEGDYGAPLEEGEIDKIAADLDNILEHLDDEGRNHILENGFYSYFKGLKKNGTALLKDGRCAFLTMDGGIAKCGIEKANLAGATSFKKPISCHLYPVRVKEQKENGFDVLQYDKWDICSAACELGEEHKVKIYQFVKDALIRKYGESFYEQLDSMAQKFSVDS